MFEWPSQPVPSLSLYNNLPSSRIGEAWDNFGHITKEAHDVAGLGSTSPRTKHRYSGARYHVIPSLDYRRVVVCSYVVVAVLPLLSMVTRASIVQEPWGEKYVPYTFWNSWGGGSASAVDLCRNPVPYLDSAASNHFTLLLSLLVAILKR
jgi:hypothetical protein